MSQKSSTHPAAGAHPPSGDAAASAGIGIDLVEVARIERALERRPRLAGRLFTEQEISYAGSRRRPGRHLAVRFAAKEAVVKAMGLGGGVSLREIEVVAGAPPRIELLGEVGRIAAERQLSVRISLTHEREMAAAVAIAEGV
jgi:holo-[acyl-carrier protein] synthase